ERFLPSWSVDPGTVVSGRFNSIDHKTDLTITSPRVKFRNFQLTDEEFSLESDNQKITLNSTSGKMYYSDSSYMESLVIEAEGAANLVDFSVRVADSAAYPNRARIEGNFMMIAPDRFD